MERIDLFCGISSLGMPNTTDNKENYGYFDYIKDYLKSKNFEVNGINFSSLDHNYTWDLEKIFKMNYYLSQIRDIQIHSIENLRNTNLLFKLVVPKAYQEKLKKMKSNERIGDIYKEAQKPIFLYSTGINDMFVFMKAGPVELLNKKTRRDIGNQLDTFINQAILNIKNNLSFLINLNSQVSIYVLGVYNSTVLKILDQIYKIQDIGIVNNPLPKNLLFYIQNKFNADLEELCNDFPNVHFIDLASLNISCAKMDFHPSKEGNIVIGEEIVKNLETTYFNNNKLR